MTEYKTEPSKHEPLAGQRNCPHLGMADDPETQFVSPDVHNTCFKAQPPNRVSIRHQARVCLSKDFASCVMFNAEKPGPLPRELQGKAQRAVSWATWVRLILLALSLLALLALAYLALTSSSRPMTVEAASTPVVPAAVMPEVTATATKVPTEVVVQPSRTPQPSSTPQVEATQAVEQITPGPALETPFGAGQAYLVHMTQEGETLDMLAARYDTSVAVLQALNLTPGQQGMWANLPMVVMPGLKDASGVSRMQAVQVDVESSVTDLAVRLGVDEADFRQENGLVDDMVPMGRWVVMHIE